MGVKTTLPTSAYSLEDYLPDFSIQDDYYSVSLATSVQELDEAFKLRFEVFNLELQEGLQSSYLTLRDEDAFDKQCHHLIIKEKITGVIIGTYRMQTNEHAQQGIGFYSGSEFQFEMFQKNVLANSVELGRACIAKAYRNKKVLFLLWCGIAQYAIAFQKRYLFGCCSLASQNINEGNKLWHQLEEDGHITKSDIIPARKEYSTESDCTNYKRMQQVNMPPLLGMYLRYGAKVISYPAIDREFKTIDYLILLDVADLNPAIKRLFFKLPESEAVYCPPK
jgi:putative hemolysin